MAGMQGRRQYWDAGQPRARRATTMEAQGTQGGGEYEVCF